MDKKRIGDRFGGLLLSEKFRSRSTSISIDRKYPEFGVFDFSRDETEKDPVER